MIKIDELETNKIKLEIQVDDQLFEEGMHNAYVKAAKHISIQGFRKGKVPRRIIEKYYGEQIFYDDAVNFICPIAYDKAIKEYDIKPVGVPELDVVQIGNGKSFIFTVVTDVRPKVELCEYKGLEIQKIVHNVTEEDISSAFEELLERSARLISVTDRKSQMGDTLIIDYEGFVDGTPFQGGKGTDFPLTLGGNTFIDNFEQQLVDKDAQEQVTVDVTFPKEYHAEELKGKQARFNVFIHDVKTKELPILDDEFARDVSEFDTLAELRVSIVDKIKEQKEASSKEELDDKVLEMLSQKIEIDIPQSMVDQQIESLLADFSKSIRAKGVSLEMYMNYNGITLEQMKEDLKKPAFSSVKNSLILSAVAKEENLVVTEEELEGEYEKMAERFQMDIEKVKELMQNQRTSLEADLLTRKTLDFILSSAHITETKEE